MFVRDNGCGISKEKLPLIFTRFEKLNAFVQGTGLGLPICQSIAERLGGRIEVESELGKGSVFALYLPYRQIHSSADKGTAYKAGQKRILVVEDIEVNFMQINAFLKKEYTILWVNIRGSFSLDIPQPVSRTNNFTQSPSLHIPYVIVPCFVFLIALERKLNNT